MSEFRYFTPEEWDGLTDAQREVIRLQRMAAVDALRLEHTRRRIALAQAADDAA